LAARELVIARLRQEASLLGAHGVLGVRLKVGGYDWSARTVEFTAVGTAIRIRDRLIDPQLFTSDLSGQEFWQLHQAGYYPRGLVFGICSYYIHTDWNTRNMMRGGFFGRGSSQNQEVAQYTQGFNLARQLAMNRLTADIRNHQASGAVGMHIDMGVEDIEYENNKTTYHDLLAHFVAVGTSIVHDLQPATNSRKSSLTPSGGCSVKLFTLFLSKDVLKNFVMPSAHQRPLNWLLQQFQLKPGKPAILYGLRTILAVNSPITVGFIRLSELARNPSIVTSTRQAVREQTPISIQLARIAYEVRSMHCAITRLQESLDENETHLN
jgi:uncharacterized protein YbjQ (UPF0145 family)